MEAQWWIWALGALGAVMLWALQAWIGGVMTRTTASEQALAALSERVRGLEVWRDGARERDDRLERSLDRATKELSDKIQQMHTRLDLWIEHCGRMHGAPSGPLRERPK